ncbi:phosphoenolpyruvate--protein phosphotransferase [Herbivorax sp. ANBcel31]|uniref:phosphoenolpyruvate--protein phosphotransferase n=1 Tax=Herbivorax sp. ANBcel31 TaxID=3069754 RepID=UPI0027B53CD2|nr:phosphoenolpyruvate--protein phosphotransferase [Herbivorax sp. ANBcel31]MDQ2086676.1 phosphoenolpyruvate--protein phosphotransferase [Herbivorax sp. ANBcel31]
MTQKVLKGKAVSTGIGMGELFVIRDFEVVISDEIIGESEIDKQITLLEVAICRTFIEIYDLKDGFRGILSEEENQIFEFYKEVLDDKSFFEEITNIIKTRKFTASKAIHICVQKYIDEISKSSNEYMKQRIHDLKDIRTRIIKNIYGEGKTNFGKINHTNIAVVKELTPIVATVLCKRSVQGVLVQDGAGFFSHGSIILRSSGTPVLGEIEFEKISAYEGSFAIVECFSDLIIVNPSNLEIEKYKKQINNSSVIDNKNQGQTPVVTTDGHLVSVYANISNVKDFSITKALNIGGIGLVRTESLYINYKKAPDEKRQYLIYSKIAKDMSKKPVVIRTADIGGDKIPDSLGINSESLKRSSRGIKRSLEKKEEFMVQIKSILRAAQHGNVKISFPMVSTPQEIRDAKNIITEVIDQITHTTNNTVKKISIGVLIETALAVKNLDDILKEVDFISIGTNDLLHQICKFNRKCSLLGKRSYLEPEFLKIVQYCIDKALANNKRVSVCGEMASDIEAAVLLVGMGVHELSMNPASCLNIGNFIRNISFKEAKGIAKIAVESESIELVKDMLSKWIKTFNT